MSAIRIAPSWREPLQESLNSPEMQQLSDFLKTEIREGREFFPPPVQLFTAFELTAFDKVKVVVLGQEPNIRKGMDHGLAFSSLPGAGMTNTTRNIFTELRNDVGTKAHPINGYLAPWARQGVLLLNCVMSVQAGKSGSHRHKGWEKFTADVVQAISDHHENIVFLMFGPYAALRTRMIDQSKHHVIVTSHPSDQTAFEGFLGSRCFSATNEFLVQAGKQPIDWAIE